MRRYLNRKTSLRTKCKGRLGKKINLHSGWMAGLRQYTDEKDNKKELVLQINNLSVRQFNWEILVLIHSSCMWFRLCKYYLYRKIILSKFSVFIGFLIFALPSWAVSNPIMNCALISILVFSLTNYTYCSDEYASNNTHPDKLQLVEINLVCFQPFPPFHCL